MTEDGPPSPPAAARGAGRLFSRPLDLGLPIGILLLGGSLLLLWRDHTGVDEFLAGGAGLLVGALSLLFYGRVRSYTRAELHHRPWVRDPRVPAVAGFVGALATMGLGMAVIDQVQGIEGSLGLNAAASPFYYYGFALLFAGILGFFVAVDTIHFHPIWLFASTVLASLYGWWNLGWYAIDLGVCGGCHAPAGPPGVDLGNFGFGPVYLPLWALLGSSVVAVVAPVVIAWLAPRDVEREGAQRR